ncbi:MAG: restriction endonuclease [Candidatus Yonathbacteria bacterium]|nr:restriction endonuclease [Candidatus Yonathbacteria bacterium]NTW47856.1 restriction endonuclease [Candidatus Yonathbacteria bacterium]
MENSKFLVFKNTRKNSIKTWEYFVNWDKVFKNKREVEIALNKMNYLLGKENLKEEFFLLLKSEPDIIKTFPILLAVREQKLEIYDKKEKTSRFFDFSSIDNMEDPEEYFEFFENTGLTNIFKKDGVKNLVDYVMGVEVGLESNGRKNRGGQLMEVITEEYIKQYSEANHFSYLAQATAKGIYERWGINISVDKSERSFDFAVYNPLKNKIKLFEVNFYNGGGSKLKAVCGEFKGLFDYLKAQGVEFVWITDGMGWNNTTRPLEEVYNHNDNIFNLSMLEEGVLNSLKW